MNKGRWKPVPAWVHLNTTSFLHKAYSSLITSLVPEYPLNGENKFCNISELTIKFLPPIFISCIDLSISLWETLDSILFFNILILLSTLWTLVLTVVISALV